MSDRNPIAEWSAFTRAVASRLDKGPCDYGRRSFDQPPAAFVGEVEEEILDTAAWSSILWTRVRRLREALV